MISSVNRIAHMMFYRIERIHQYEIYPFIHSFSNIPSFEEQLKPISIPDVLPSGIPQGIDFSMVAGDFVEIYGDDNHKGNISTALLIVIR